MIMSAGADGALCVCGHVDGRHLLGYQEEDEDDVYPCERCSCLNYAYSGSLNAPPLDDLCQLCGHRRFYHLSKSGGYGCDGVTGSKLCLCTGFMEPKNVVLPTTPQPSVRCSCGHAAGQHTYSGCRKCEIIRRHGGPAECYLGAEQVISEHNRRAAIAKEPTVKKTQVEMNCYCGHFDVNHSVYGCAVCNCVRNRQDVVALHTPVEVENLAAEPEQKLLVDAAKALYAVRGGYQNIENKKRLERTLERVVEVGTKMKFYDRQGKEIDVFEWTDKGDDNGYRLVGLTQCGSLMVSTFWVGISYGNKELGIKGIFESSVGDSSDPSYSKYFKWDNEAEATEGHEKLVNAAEMKSKVKRVDALTKLKEYTP